MTLKCNPEKAVLGICVTTPTSSLGNISSSCFKYATAVEDGDRIISLAFLSSWWGSGGISDAGGGGSVTVTTPTSTGDSSSFGYKFSTVTSFSFEFVTAVKHLEGQGYYKVDKKCDMAFTTYRYF